MIRLLGRNPLASSEKKEEGTTGCAFQGPSDSSQPEAERKASFRLMFKRKSATVCPQNQVVLDLGLCEDVHSSPTRTLEEEDAHLILMEGGLFGKSKETNGRLQKQAPANKPEYEAADMDAFLWSNGAASPGS
jgi:hypothetical protein